MDEFEKAAPREREAVRIARRQWFRIPHRLGGHRSHAARPMLEVNVSITL